MTKPHLKRRAGELGVAASVLALLLSGCAGAGETPSPSLTVKPSFQELATAELAGLVGVTKVTVDQQPVGAVSEKTDRRNAKLWSIDLAVQMDPTGSADAAAAAAKAEVAFSKKFAGGSTTWTAWISPRGDGVPWTGDVSPAPAVIVPVYPATADAAITVSRAVEAFDGGGMNSLTVTGDWPSVGVTDASQLEAIYQRVSTTPLFAKGATFDSPDGRVQVIYSPEHFNGQGLSAIFAIAVTYPDVKIALVAAAHGTKWPVLYIDKATAAESAAITASLADPALAGANVGGWVVPFSVSGEAPTTSGTFGSVPKA